MQAPPLLGRAFRSIMKIGRALIGFIIFCVACLFIFINDVYLQECSAAFILRVKMYRCRGRGVVTEIFEINVLRTWFVYIESRISPKSSAQAPVILAGLGNSRSGEN